MFAAAISISRLTPAQSMRIAGRALWNHPIVQRRRQKVQAGVDTS